MEPQSGFGPKEPEVYQRYLTFLASRNAVPSKKLRHRSEQLRTEAAITIASLGRQGGASSADTVASTPPFNLSEVEMRGEDGVTAWPPPDVLDDPATHSSATEEELRSALPVTFATSTGAEASTAATFREGKDSASSSNQEKHVKLLNS